MRGPAKQSRSYLRKAATLYPALSSPQDCFVSKAKLAMTRFFTGLAVGVPANLFVTTIKISVIARLCEAISELLAEGRDATPGPFIASGLLRFQSETRNDAFFLLTSRLASPPTLHWPALLLRVFSSSISVKPYTENHNQQYRNKDIDDLPFHFFIIYFHGVQEAQLYFFVTGG